MLRTGAHAPVSRARAQMLARSVACMQACAVTQIPPAPPPLPQPPTVLPGQPIFQALRAVPGELPRHGRITTPPCADSLLHPRYQRPERRPWHARIVRPFRLPSPCVLPAPAVLGPEPPGAPTLAHTRPRTCKPPRSHKPTLPPGFRRAWRP